MIEDLYSLFRQPVSPIHRRLESGKVLGTFDPATFTIWVDNKVAASRFLNAAEGGTSRVEEGEWPDVVRYSTYLHELVHWWQHIGTTSGFLCASTIPLQVALTVPWLQRMTASAGLRKPLRTQVSIEDYPSNPDDQKALNYVVNTWVDLEMAQGIIFNPALYTRLTQDSLFESVGHSLFFTVTMLVEHLSNVFKDWPTGLPQYEPKSTEYYAQVKDKMSGFRFGETPSLPSIGLRDVFESQARFHQLQYLAKGCARDISWDYFAKDGYLAEQYTRAFRLFLNLADLPWPKSALDPIVNLFLLVCELAAMPGAGYPQEIGEFRDFWEDLQPGFRFTKAASYIGRHKILAHSITEPSLSEYRDIEGTLCHGCRWSTTNQILGAVETIHQRLKNHPLILQEQELRSPFGTSYEAYSIVYARHLQLMSDKARNPHWFCWPGQYWTGDAGDGAVREFAKTVLANEPLLMCSGEGRKVRYLPPLSIRRPDDQAQRHLAYSLIKTAIFRDIHRQIVSRPGPLSFAYTWIDPNASADNYRSMVVKEVEATLKRGLDEFQPYPS